MCLSPGNMRACLFGAALTAQVCTGLKAVLASVPERGRSSWTHSLKRLLQANVTESGPQGEKTETEGSDVVSKGWIQHGFEAVDHPADGNVVKTGQVRASDTSVSGTRTARPGGGDGDRLWRRPLVGRTRTENAQRWCLPGSCKVHRSGVIAQHQFSVREVLLQFGQVAGSGEFKVLYINPPLKFGRAEEKDRLFSISGQPAGHSHESRERPAFAVIAGPRRDKDPTICLGAGRGGQRAPNGLPVLRLGNAALFQSLSVSLARWCQVIFGQTGDGPELWMDTRNRDMQQAEPDDQGVLQLVGPLGGAVQSAHGGLVFSRGLGHELFGPMPVSRSAGPENWGRGPEAAQRQERGPDLDEIAEGAVVDNQDSIERGHAPHRMGSRVFGAAGHLCVPGCRGGKKAHGVDSRPGSCCPVSGWSGMHMGPGS